MALLIIAVPWTSPRVTHAQVSFDAWDAASIHAIEDFMGVKKDANFAYGVLLGDAARIAERIDRGSSVPA
jgi:hypothetical protein